MIVQSGSFAPLFRPGLRRDFKDTWDEYPTEYTAFLKVERSNQPEQRAAIMTGMNRLVERGDALGFIISRRTVEDDQYGKANQSAKWLAHAARMTYEYRAAALLDDAFTGNFFRGIDNLPLISTAHTLLNSSLTVSNRLANDAAIGVASIEAMFDLYQAMRDENGDPVPMFPTKLILGNAPGDYSTALKIWNSDLEPFTANNTDNSIRRRMPNPNLMISHYKANPKSWFMVDEKRNDAHMVIRRPVAFDDTFDFETKAAKYSVDTRFLVWFVTWYGWAGSNPS
jgi:hypothetical protein